MLGKNEQFWDRNVGKKRATAQAVVEGASRPIYRISYNWWGPLLTQIPPRACFDIEPNWGGSVAFYLRSTHIAKALHSLIQPVLHGSHFLYLWSCSFLSHWPSLPLTLADGGSNIWKVSKTLPQKNQDTSSLKLKNLHGEMKASYFDFVCRLKPFKTLFFFQPDTV